MDTLTHEREYRTEEIIDRRSKFPICILGIGALGSNLIPLLINNGFKQIQAIDKDRVDGHNVGNQYFSLLDVGKKKSQTIKIRMQREEGVGIETIDRAIENISPDKFKRFGLLVDTFDNWDARKYSQKIAAESKVNLVHAGMSDQGYSEVRWDERYSIPETEDDQEDVCEYPLARNLVSFTVSVLSEVICTFCDKGIKMQAAFTLDDLNLSVIY